MTHVSKGQFWHRWVQFGLRRLPHREGYCWQYGQVPKGALRRDRSPNHYSDELHTSLSMWCQPIREHVPLVGASSVSDVYRSPEPPDVSCTPFLDMLEARCRHDIPARACGLCAPAARAEMLVAHAEHYDANAVAWARAYLRALDTGDPTGGATPKGVNRD